MLRITTLIISALMLTTALAQTGEKASSPIGLWKTIDDKTGQPRGIVRVYETDGRYFARIERGLIPGEEGRKCTACTDERKDQPFNGLVLMRNVKLDSGEYSGGDILDPNTGSVYRCNFKLEDDGRTLTVRGYLGVSLFGRTQKWLREPG
ncbi:MAG: DUF2147 domain-containing protein [Rhodoferax sp.]|nr:DUF2147 domain-containing protein [Rhodoferax sp.]